MIHLTMRFMQDGQVRHTSGIYELNEAAMRVNIAREQPNYLDYQIGRGE